MNYLKQLKLIFGAVAGSMALLIFISWVLVRQNITGNNPAAAEFENLMEYLVPALVFVIPFAAVFIFHYKTKHIRENIKSVKEKKEAYRSATVIKVALFEAAQMIALAAYLLTGGTMFFVLSTVVFIALIIQIPADYKVVRDIDIKIEELMKEE